MKVEYFDTDVVAAINELSATLLSYVGALALLLLVGTGIYYMMAQGNPRLQARAKQSFSYILLGLIVVLLSYSILGVIKKIAAD